MDIEQPINKVTSVFWHQKNQRFYLEFFDNTGKKKQKSTRLNWNNTKANKNKIWREIVPLFETKLTQKAEEEAKRQKVLADKPLSYYTHKYQESLQSSHHTKAKAQSSRADKILDYFGADTLPKDVTELDIEDFFEHLDVSRDTKSDWKVVLTAIFEKARKDRAIPVNIVKQFALPAHEQQNTPESKRMPFNTDEMQKIIENAPRMQRNYLGIAFHTGMRPEEVIALKFEDIDFESKEIYLKYALTKGVYKKISPKKGGERDVPLFDEALPFILDQMEWATENNSPFLFFNAKGERLNDSLGIRGHHRKKGFYWKRYLEELNITPYRRMMNARHTFAVHSIRNMEELNLTLNDIASIMGHTSLRMLINHYGKYIQNKNKLIPRDLSIYGNNTKKVTEYSTECA